MKFSILLPTRNRLDLLKLAVQSVLEQDYPDWQIVISDNASVEDVASYVQALADDRIRYLRTDTLLPVTANWNRALEASDGDYVIMLGDDDCLLENCLSILAKLIDEYRAPELIYVEAIQFAYPGVVPEAPNGFVQHGYCAFLNGESQPFLLDRKIALDCVRSACSFRITYGYNMQHSVISRAAIAKLSADGAFFRSPYPDYYATNALFLAAREILVVPWPLVGIGISAKSFGFFYLNRREAEGVAFLHNAPQAQLPERIAAKIVPGVEMYSSWMLAMEALSSSTAAKPQPKVIYWRYRYMQFLAQFRQSRSRGAFLLFLREHATAFEEAFWTALSAMDLVASKVLPARLWRSLLHRLLVFIHRPYPIFDARKREVPYKNILEMSHAESGRRAIPLHWASH
jgi:glycosyltransferase involved in cell wall biosynthesis